MAIKVFLTGSTGYIGGEVLYAVLEAYPDANVSVLVRNEERGKQVTSKFPSVTPIYGELESSDVIEEQAAKADFVIHTADSSDHVGAAEAIGRGLLKGHSESNPGYWLHIGGTGILTFWDSQHERYGEPPVPDQTYDDWDGIERVVNLPDEAFHRNVDKIVLGYGNEHADVVKTAIICPPTICGPGRGPVNQRSRQVYSLVRRALKNRQVEKIGKGESEWDFVHVQDLSKIFVLLIQAALDGKDSTEYWGKHGYYFTAASHFVWGEVSAAVAKLLKPAGLVDTEEVKSLDGAEVLKQGDFEVLSWGLNSKGHAFRANKLLGWTPQHKTIYEILEDIIDAQLASHEHLR